MPNEILIEVAYALPKKQLIIPVKVKQGITAEEAIQLSGITKKFPEIDLSVNQIGIFGKLTQLDHVMRERDRIEDYPLFLPWCGGSKVLERNSDITRASIHIKYSGVNQSFTTQNTKEYPQRIDLKLIDGPFKVLEGYWIFTKINEEACSIEFHLHYEFSNFILDKLISPIFSQIANTFVDGFVTQADKIYTK